MSFKFVDNEVKRLSQEEGLNDSEIAEIIGCDRTTILKIRKDNDIPKCNLSNKKDKLFTCGRCKNTELVRRCEPRRYLCDSCKKEMSN